MREASTERSPNSKARAAGGLWWLCIISGMIGFIAGGPLIVPNDAVTTAANILAKESLFRLGIAADLLSGLSYVGVTAFMYYLLEPVSRSLSFAGAFFGLAGVAIGGASWVIHLTPLLLLHGDSYLTAFTTSQLQAMSLAALKLQLQAFPIGMVFFGIQCMSIGYLVARSTFLPRLLGVILAIGGTCYVIVSFANFVAPSVGPHLVPFLMPVALIGEGALSLWLLAKGVNAQRWHEQGEAAVSLGI